MNKCWEADAASIEQNEAGCRHYKNGGINPILIRIVPGVGKDKSSREKSWSGGGGKTENKHGGGGGCWGGGFFLSAPSEIGREKKNPNPEDVWGTHDTSRGSQKVHKENKREDLG